VRSIVRTLYHHRNEREREKRKSKKCTYMVDCNVRVSRETSRTPVYETKEKQRGENGMSQRGMYICGVMLRMCEEGRH